MQNANDAGVIQKCVSVGVMAISYRDFVAGMVTGLTFSIITYMMGYYASVLK